MISIRQFANVLIDFLIIAIAFFLSYCLRQAWGFSSIQPLSFYFPFVAASAVTLVFSFAMFRLYESDRVLFSLSYLVEYLKALFLWGSLIVAFSYFTKTDYSRAVIIIFFLLTAVLATGARIFLAYRVFPRSSHVRGDPQVLKAVGDMVRLSQLSSDSLALLEGLRLQRKPGLFYRVSKRILDIVLASTGILVMLPIFPLIVFWIRWDSPGKALISQQRVGKGGRRFILYKFRTMSSDAELYAPAPRGNDDSRVTRAGRILRRYSLDELPQLWNVIKGEMSIVGPRPEMPFVVESYKPWQRMRLAAKPGITGLWQIFGRKDLPLEENLEYDLYYIFNQSFFLDLAIILKTVPKIILGNGAF